jgi:hypothetical protein
MTLSTAQNLYAYVLNSKNRTMWKEAAVASLETLEAFFSCLTDKRRSNVPPDDMPALRRTSRVGEV